MESLWIPHVLTGQDADRCWYRNALLPMNCNDSVSGGYSDLPVYTGRSLMGIDGLTIVFFQRRERHSAGCL